ncbi:MAG TPA: sugar ABC transporter substrate-binding protein [Trueperaceae bacterium]
MRRSLYAVLALCALVFLSTAAAQDFDWRRFEGTEIRFLMNQHPFTDFITPLVPEFEKLTGIKVTLEAFPEAQFRQKRLLEVSSNAATLDGYMIMPGQVGAQYLGADWVTYLDDMIADPSMTNPDLDLDDFFDGALNTFRNGDRLYGLPLQNETSLLFYRKDLFEEAGLSGPPETMAELMADAQLLNKDGRAGFAMRGAGASATSQIVNFLMTFGGKWLNEDGSSALDSEASKEALAFYTTLLNNYGPAGVTNMSWPEVTSLFAQDQAAMMFGANVFRSIMEDPEQTKDVVRENIAYAPIPAGPVGRKPVVLVWGLSVNHASKHPGAAWYFIQWALSKENQLKAGLAGVPAARESAWQDPEFQETAPADWIEASQKHFAIADPNWNPPVVPVSEVRDAYGQAIIAALQGQPIGRALQRAADQMDEIVARSQQ